MCYRRLHYVVKACLAEDDIRIIDLRNQAGLGSRETQPRGTENAAPRGGGRQHFWKVVAPAESSKHCHRETGTSSGLDVFLKAGSKVQ